MFKEIPTLRFFSPEVGFAYDFRNSLITKCGYRLLHHVGGHSPGTLQPLYFHLIFITPFKQKTMNKLNLLIVFILATVLIHAAIQQLQMTY
jgi:hypothetical protein